MSHSFQWYDRSNPPLGGEFTYEGHDLPDPHALARFTEHILATAGVTYTEPIFVLLTDIRDDWQPRPMRWSTALDEQSTYYSASQNIPHHDISATS